MTWVFLFHCSSLPLCHLKIPVIFELVLLKQGCGFKWCLVSMQPTIAVTVLVYCHMFWNFQLHLNSCFSHGIVVLDGVWFQCILLLLSLFLFTTISFENSYYILTRASEMGLWFSMVSGFNAAYYRGAMGILLVYDVTDESSFNSIHSYFYSDIVHTNFCKFLLDYAVHRHCSYTVRGFTVNWLNYHQIFETGSGILSSMHRTMWTRFWLGTRLIWTRARE